MDTPPLREQPERSRCTADTAQRRRCLNRSAPWPIEAVPIGEPRCRTHMTSEQCAALDAARQKESADQEQRWRRWYSAFDPACWSWPPEPPTVEDSDDDPETLAGRVLFGWHDRRCAVCGTRGAALVKDHDHATGLVRGLLCRSCNGLEGHAGDFGPFAKYRERPPTKILGLTIRYLDPFTGQYAEPAPPPASLDDHPSYKLAALLADRLQSHQGEGDGGAHNP